MKDKTLFRGVVCTLLVLALASWSAAQLSGAYTIDPAGSGPNNYATFAAASTALAAGVGTGGATFDVAPVTFNETVTFNAVPGASATNPVKIICTAATKAVIKSTTASAYGLTLSSAKWFEIENIHVDSVYRALYCSQADDNRFVNCKFSAPNYVVYSQGMDRCVFDGCEVDGLGAASRLLAPYNANDSDCLFQNCFFHSCSPTGLGVYINVSGYGIMFWHNTVIVTTSANAVHLGGCCAWSRANSFRNNIVVNMGTGVAIKYGHRSGVLDYNDADYNCYYAPNGNACELESGTTFTTGTLAQWKTFFNANRATLVPQGTAPIPTPAQARWDDNSIEANPGLVSMTAPYDIHITGSSPCLDAGTTQYVAGNWISYSATYVVLNDYEGDTRPATNVDIGADEVAIKITGAGSGLPGSTITFSLFSPSDASLAYQVGSSLGNGPIMIDTRKIELSPDPLLFLSVGGQLPAIFANYLGFLDATGNATAKLNIPNIPQLKGFRIYTAFLTLKASAPSGISNISNSFLFTIQ